MKQTEKEEKINFFYNEEVVKKHNGKLMAYYFQPSNINKIVGSLTILGTMTIIFFFLNLMFGAISSHMKDESNLSIKQVQMEHEHLKKIVKNLEPVKLNELISFAKENETHELNRLNDLYWKVKFVDSSLTEDQNKRYEATIKEYYSNIDDIQNKINTHYNSRIDTFISFYSNINNENYNAIIDTYDHRSAEEIVIWWKNAQTQHFYSKYTDIDDLDMVINKAFNYDKLELAKFLESHKTDIEKTKVIFSDKSQ